MHIQYIYVQKFPEMYTHTQTDCLYLHVQHPSWGISSVRYECTWVRRYWALTYCCNVEVILSFIVFCFKILGIGALFGVNVLIFLSLPDYAINQTGLQEKAEQIFKEAAVIHWQKHVRGTFRSPSEVGKLSGCRTQPHTHTCCDRQSKSFFL